MLLLLTWHCYFVAFHVSSHNNVMSESQTWDIEFLFMFQCEGSNSHFETYKSCIFCLSINSFLNCYGKPISRQFYCWFSSCVCDLSYQVSWWEIKHLVCLTVICKTCLGSHASVMLRKNATKLLVILGLLAWLTECHFEAK